MTYSAAQDGYQSWLLAIREARLKGVRENRFSPINEEEQAIANAILSEKDVIVSGEKGVDAHLPALTDET